MPRRLDPEFSAPQFESGQQSFKFELVVSKLLVSEAVIVDGMKRVVRIFNYSHSSVNPWDVRVHGGVSVIPDEEIGRIEIYNAMDEHQFFGSSLEEVLEIVHSDALMHERITSFALESHHIPFKFRPKPELGE